MLGIIFGAMVVMLILTVPIGVMLLVVSLIPSLISPGFSASIPVVLRNVVGGLNSTPYLQSRCLSWVVSSWHRAALQKNCLMFSHT